MPALRSDDRVLSLVIPPSAEVAALARTLTAGCFVGLGDSEEVNRARREFAAFNNLVFVESAPDRISWSDGYFTKVLVPWQLQPLIPSLQSELMRVLAPGGEIVSNIENV